MTISASNKNMEERVPSTVRMRRYRRKREYENSSIVTVVVTNLASTQLKRTSKGENTLKLGNWVIVIKMYFKLEISFGSK